MPGKKTLLQQVSIIQENSGTLLIHVDSKHINDYTTLDKTLNNIKVENLNADTKKTKLKSIATNLTNDIKLKDKIRNRIKNKSPKLTMKILLSTIEKSPQINSLQILGYFCCEPIHCGIKVLKKK